MNKRNAHMNKCGEVVTGLLIGLAVGGIIWLVNANNYAAEKANREGGTVYFSEYAKEEPTESAITVFGPAAAGADYYNKITGEYTNTLPKIISADGKTTLKPKWVEYYDAGWRLASSTRSEPYSIPSDISYSTNFISQGTNKPPKGVIFRNITWQPINVEKPSFVQLAVRLHLA